MEQRCAAEVSTGMYGMQNYQCRKPHHKDGWCIIHHPDSKAKRRVKSENDYKEKQEARRRQDARFVAQPQYKGARKLAGLLTYAEARKLGANI